MTKTTKTFNYAKYNQIKKNIVKKHPELGEPGKERALAIRANYAMRGRKTA